MERVILKGTQAGLSLPDLFELLRFKRGPICCRVTGDGFEANFYLKNGRVVWAENPGQTEPIGVYLVRIGALSNTTLMQELGRIDKASGNGGIGRHLVQNGLIDKRHISQALRLRTIDLAKDVFNRQRHGQSPGGEVEQEIDILVYYVDDEDIPNRIEDPMSVDNLLLEVARYTDEEQSLMQQVGSTDVPLLIQEQQLAEDIEFSQTEWDCLKLINNKRTVDNILTISHHPRVEVLKALVVFFNLGIVRRGLKRGSKRRVLIVDDSLTSRHLVGFVMGEAGFDVDEAGDGESALDKAHKNPPDLVVLDVMLPGINGYEVCSKLKKDPRTAKVPVILLTSLTGFTDKLRGRLVRADVYLEKPFKEEELTRIAQKLTERNRV